jgi:hypothetical protein
LRACVAIQNSDIPCSSQKVLVQHIIKLLTGQLALLSWLDLLDQGRSVGMLCTGWKGSSKFLQQQQQQMSSSGKLIRRGSDNAACSNVNASRQIAYGDQPTKLKQQTWKGLSRHPWRDTHIWDTHSYVDKFNAPMMQATRDGNNMSHPAQHQLDTKDTGHAQHQLLQRRVLAFASMKPSLSLSMSLKERRLKS